MYYWYDVPLRSESTQQPTEEELRIFFSTHGVMMWLD